MLSKTLNNFLKFLFLLLIGAYRTVASAWLGGACRFEPSCSEYCSQAFHQHHFLTAFKLSVLRLSRCRPGGGFGYDPLPSPESQIQSQLHCCRGHL